MDPKLISELQTLETTLTELQSNGIRLNKSEQTEIAKTLHDEAEENGFLKFLKNAEQTLDSVLPLITPIISLAALI